MGYVNELVARLTSRPVANVTNINRTLDSDPRTFPLSRAIYADFSHDNQMLPIYAALGLHRPSSDLPTEGRAGTDSPWVASKLVPFTARLAVEKYSCGHAPAADLNLNGRTSEGKDPEPRKEWVRIVNNDRVIDVPACSNSRAGGLCELGAFIDTLGYALSGAPDDWARCHEAAS